MTTTNANLSERLVEIAVATYTQAATDLFTYRFVDDLEPRPGQLVEIPFAGRRLRGIVWRTNASLPAEVKAKPIGRVLSESPVLQPWQMQLVDWLADRYQASYQRCLQTVAPYALKPTPAIKTIERLALTPLAESEGLPTLGARQRQALMLLRQQGKLSKKELNQTYGIGYSSLSALVDKGLVSIEQHIPAAEMGITATSKTPPELTSEQQHAVTRMTQSDAHGEVFVLDGVTNSGKTEVYLRLIEHALKSNQQSILLVPEIALTPQTVEQIAGRFPGITAIWHSKLNDSERHLTYTQVATGQIKVVVGSRSALFLPLARPGYLLVDESHEISYKQSSSPRYLTHAVAEQLAQLRHFTVVFGSATPSVETLEQTHRGRWHHLRLPRPVNADRTEPPRIELVDLRASFQGGNRRTLSDALVRELQRNLQAGEQSILFLNRRGRSTYVFCRDCGEALNCPRCEIPLTYHTPARQKPFLLCHHCDYRSRPPDLCPHCQSQHIRFLGAGTQKVISDLGELFPQARLLRLDADTTTSRFSYQTLFEKIRSHEVDIIVGTQMIAKGWNLPRVSLVGVLLAEQSLHFPDFRAGERTFQLLTQVIGRAGRDQLPARVVIQTYQPENPYIRFAAEQQRDEFVAYELKQRQSFGYPPYGEVVKLTLDDTDEARGQAKAESTLSDLRQKLQAYPEIRLLGPIPAFVPRSHGKYHFQAILHGHNLHDVLDCIPKAWTIDVDPLSML